MGSVTISDGSNEYARCDDVVKVDQIAKALQEEEARQDQETGGRGRQLGKTVSIECESHTWTVGKCWAGSVELLVRPTGQPTKTCQCYKKNALVVRPCIGNRNWGGLLGQSCSSRSQRMKVTFEPADDNMGW
eukprot:CAMPEP_0174295110 /NCGR_PEP_ID=MMETSP0809-20121228/43677_1 /TAXON_ID=73025 ORGANISM="Eutreptiella gymnastica-like, Strain CCMP1594" /NCGR_SAMPLE_ID=MMETSP0809 /ASSEMBLY_ACC=CAM_ASM_000658 /LENGTH=131 /DNA_ID=CAMNT_0015397099 /DNA_START=186 /DNA_END=581 /DNA_ORIENTATION=-